MYWVKGGKTQGRMTAYMYTSPPPPSLSCHTQQACAFILGSKERTLVVDFGVNDFATAFKALEVRGG